MNKLKVGVIGLGSWGECHVEAYQSLPQAEVVAVSDLREDRIEAVCSRFGIADGYQDYKELLARPDIDLVSIVTYEKDHLLPTLDALNAGKHVMVEKPTATNPTAANAMWKAALANKRVIVPGHLLRFEPRYAEIYNRIRSGSIGQPQTIYMKRSRPKSLFQTYKRTHTVYELSVHDIDLAIWYAGSRVATAKAYGRNIAEADVPDVLWIVLKFYNGTLAFINNNWVSPDEAHIAMNDSIEVVGSEGIAQFDNRGTGLEIWDAAGRSNPTADFFIHHQLSSGVVGALRDQLGYLCDCLLQGVEPDYLSFSDAVHGVQVMDAVVRSIAYRNDEIPIEK